jgi:putative membrane protein
MARMRARTAVIAVGLLSGSALIGSAPAQTGPANAPTASGPAITAQHALTKIDRDFVDNAAHGGLAEVELSRLAQKSANPDVRNFADRMITDHTKANARLAAIAKAGGVAVPNSLDAEHQQLREKLANEHDGNFDRDYAHAMVVDHDQAIRLFQREELSGGDASLKEFARNTLPTLQEHRGMAVALANKLGATAAR